ncbi:hypothetical protein BCR37DRAFT_343205 [Protomyces lactucae-debilis]|uniref:Uncharacterized protein n=1 Tax=Protomyces lactucae-debilis TaxID=2754530 RepID=A0A1Y2FT06_PROLT|nr:uncharacterized protein BCR37DRAFT_343205 [Protomyces lactucae-debilis]ORY87141.1 hypothetical protein BCR37DRAFT_343205 [Protomyces lactucae-debilis]
MASPITSVQQQQSRPVFFGNSYDNYDEQDDGQAPLISLSVRGSRFDISREELTNLPESILLCLFPHGLMLDDHQESLISVDFDPLTLQYVLDFFRKALLDAPAGPALSSNAELLPGKAAIIVLKEDLDFYVIPPKGLTPATTSALRHAAGAHLVQQSSIFDGLRKSGHKSAGTAEQHLIDMLCASGFNAEDNWSKRLLEPGKAGITSLALALLKQGNTATGMATSQKLLLFWRKPARKCWWDAVYPTSEDLPGVPLDGPVKIWARRVWTLELSITG